MTVAFWRIADTGAGDPGPWRRAYGDPAPTVAGLPPGTVIEVDLGNGVLWPGIVPGVPSTPAVTLTLTPAGPIPADAPAGTAVATITGVAPPHATLTLTGADAALLAISDGQIVTAAALTGRASLLVSVSAAAAGYTPVTRSAAVTVQAVNPDPDPDPDDTLTIATTPGVELEAAVSPDGEVTITVTAPPEYIGTYVLDPADLASGPVALVPVAVSGNRYLGDTLTAVPALWVHDVDAGPLVATRRWYLGDDPVEDEGVLTHTRATLGVAPRYVETATDSRGSRSSIFETAATVAIGELPDTFTAPDGTSLAEYIGESGIAWRARSSGSNRAGRIADGRVHSEWNNIHISVDRLADLPADQFAEGVMVIGSGAGAWDSGVGLAVRIDPAANSYYRAHYNGTHWRVAKIVGGTQTVLAQQAWANPGAGTEVQARLEVLGDQLALLINGEVLLTATDGSIAGGRAGLGVNSASPAGTRMEITQFHAGGM